MPEPSLSFFIVDAFTDRLFSGNPAAVCILHETKTDEWLQNVAAEFNLSETAFLWPQGDNRWQLRWFTPTCEVKLCGHATLASAHVLARELGFKDETFLFSTLSGTLAARVNAMEITLEFPKPQCVYLSKIYLHENGIDQLNLNIEDAYQTGGNILLLLASEQEIQNYQPEFEKIAEFTEQGLIITAPGDAGERDFVSRFFAPRLGVNEDPVTGSAHCCLAVYWSQRLGKVFLHAEQLSQRRGFVKMQVNTDSVTLVGTAKTFAQGSCLSA